MKNKVTQGIRSGGKAAARLVPALQNGALLLISFVLIRTPVFGISVPFSVSLAAAVDGKQSVFAAAGAAAGALFLPSADRAAALALLGGVMMLRLLFSGVKAIRITNQAAVMTAAVFAMSTVSLAAKLAAGGFSADSLIIGVCVSILTAGAVPVFRLAAFSLRHGMGTYLPDKSLFFAAAGVMCILVSSLSAVEFFGVRPVCAACFTAVSAVGFLGGTAAGSAAGTLAMAALACPGTPPVLCLCLPLSGLAAGACREAGKIPGICAVLAAAACFSLIESTRDGAAFFVEAAAGELIFFAIPRKVLLSAGNRFLVSAGEQNAPGVSETLRKAAGAMENVSQCVEKVTEGIVAVTPGDSELMAARICERVCSDCPLYNSCYCPDKGDIDRAVSIIRSRGTVGESDFRADFSENCPCFESICTALSDIYRGVCAASVISVQNARSRELTCRIFSTVSCLLAELSRKTGESKAALNESERLAKRKLTELGAEVFSVCASEPVSGALRLEVTAALPHGMPPGKVGILLGKAFGICFEPPSVSAAENGISMVFEQEAGFVLCIGSASRSAEAGGLCGDNFRSFTNGQTAYIVLSDGMGTGGRAAVDAAMTVDIFSRLIKAGFSADAALAVTGAALNVRGGEEAAATLDVAEVNLFTGEATLFKAGAAPSFCTRKGGVRTLDSSSMPLGILPGTEFRYLKTELFEGDVLLMASDGICSGSERLENTLKNAFPVDNAGDLAEAVLADAIRRSRGRPDDMTVITAVLRKRSSGNAEKSKSRSLFGIAARKS